MAPGLKTTYYLIVINPVERETQGSENNPIHTSDTHTSKFWCKLISRMYNIIRYLPGGDSGNNLPNANILSEEYGYSTELITQSSVKCQEKHGGFSFNPYTKGYVQIIFLKIYRVFFDLSSFS